MFDNKSFLLNGILDTSFAQRPVPDLAPNDVLVEVKKTGICGSDVHFYVEGRIAQNVVTQPFVLGHESSGIVAKVGSAVKGVHIGDRVAMEPGATCRVCDECKSGKYHLCEHCEFAAAHPRDGTLGRYYRIPADLTYKLPENLTLEDGAMESFLLPLRCLMEPLAVAVHAINYLTQLRAGQSVIVFGAGPVGLLCMAVARALGALRVIAVDIVSTRLDFAQGYAATDVFQPPSLESGESKMDYSKRAVALLNKTLGVEERGPKSLDLAIDATGAETCIQMAFLVAKIGGTLLQVGFGATEIQVPITLLLVKELTVKGSFRYGPGDYPLALALASTGKVNLKPLVTHRFKFEDAVSAFDITRAGKGVNERGQDTGVIKAIISGPDTDLSPL